MKYAYLETKKKIILSGFLLKSCSVTRDGGSAKTRLILSHHARSILHDQAANTTSTPTRLIQRTVKNRGLDLRLRQNSATHIDHLVASLRLRQTPTTNINYLADDSYNYPRTYIHFCKLNE